MSQTADTTPSQLTIRHLAKSYKKREVIKDVSLDIASGEIIGLLGPNGAGKTTCFYMIVGLVQADKGSIHLNEQDISTIPMHARAQKGIGYLPQESSIFRKLTVTENILGILQTRKDLTRKQQREELNKLLEEFHITHIKDSQGMALSGGERRRVEIARALANNPQFILLDEPFAGVDPISVHDIQDIIRHLQQRNIGVLITDHNVRETLGICQRAYIVGAGKIIAHGDAQTILANKQVRDIYLGDDFHL